MESKFKVGDRVVWADKEYAMYNNWSVDSIMTIEEIVYSDHEGCHLLWTDNGASAYDFRLKLYKEDPVKQFDMHTQPWFIRVNNEQEFHLVQEWLKENFGTRCNFGWHSQMMGLTNTAAHGKIYNSYVMWFSDDKSLNQNSQEIKLKVKTTIDSVEWPVVESEKDKKIRELKKTIEAAAKQIKELDEM